MITCGNVTFSLHPLFILLLAAAALMGYIFELLTLFTIVLIHELGHVACAKAFGWKIKEVKLFPFGGVAETEEETFFPAWQEWLVAVAGPVQNGIMIGLALLAEYLGWTNIVWTQWFVQANTFIALFNLLPILPLDGGRMLQAMCSLWMGYYYHLLLGARIGILFSLVLVGWSIYPFITNGKLNLNLLLLSLFMLWVNRLEHKHIPYRFVRFLMHRPDKLRHWEQKAVSGRPIVTHKNNPLSSIMKRFRKDDYHIIYVIGDDGRIHRILPEQQLIEAYFRHPIYK